MIQLKDMQSVKETVYNNFDELLEDLEDRDLYKIREHIIYEADEIYKRIINELYFSDDQEKVHWEKGIEYRYYIDFLYFE